MHPTWFRRPWFQWHYDRFDVPPGRSNSPQRPCGTSFVIGHSLGLQFHPELDGPLLEAWLANDGAEAIALASSRRIAFRDSPIARRRRSSTPRLGARLHDRVVRQPCPSLMPQCILEERLRKRWSRACSLTGITR